MALLALTLALLAMTEATTDITEKPLDMALDSFDDQYKDCGPAMKEKLPALNSSEFKNNPLFAKGWQKAMTLWQELGSPVSPLSSSAHAIALAAYSMVYLHKDFNEDVSVGGRSPQAYRDNFHFKTLHFLLTDALATLRDAQGQKCHRVFSFVDKYKFKANVGDIIRFGQFMWASPWKDDIPNFRTPTVFQVTTCHGANFNAFIANPKTEAVLIPPFEKFKVTNVIENGKNVQIHLDSFGTDSKYNCEWLKGGSVPRAPWHLGGFLLATTALGMATGMF